VNDLYVEIRKGRERAKDILNRKDQKLDMKASEKWTRSETQKQLRKFVMGWGRDREREQKIKNQDKKLTTSCINFCMCMYWLTLIFT